MVSDQRTAFSSYMTRLLSTGRVVFSREEARQALQRARQLWHVRSEDGFPWRGFKIDRYNLQLRDEVIGEFPLGVPADLARDEQNAGLGEDAVGISARAGPIFRIDHGQAAHVDFPIS